MMNDDGLIPLGSHVTGVEYRMLGYNGMYLYRCRGTVVTGLETSYVNFSYSIDKYTYKLEYICLW